MNLQMLESCCVWLWETKGHLRASFIVSVAIWEGRNERHERSLSRNRSGHFEESSSYLSLSRVVSWRALGNQKQHKQADETLRTVLGHSPQMFFSVADSLSDAALAPAAALPSVRTSEVNGKVPTITENAIMSFQQLWLRFRLDCIASC